jgi:hypothetical protein
MFIDINIMLNGPNLAILYPVPVFNADYINDEQGAGGNI